MKSQAVALLFALAAMALSSHAALADFAAGDCVLARGTPAVIVGPSNVEGEYMARDSRLSEGAGQSFRPDQLKAVPCPGAPVAQNVCFASDEGASASDLEQVVRHALRTSLEQSEYTTTVSLDRVVIGEPHGWTGDEEVEFGAGDPTKAIVDARVLYRTCVDQVTDIYITRQENNFACFSETVDGQIVCEIAGSGPGLEPPTSQTLSKY